MSFFLGRLGLLLYRTLWRADLGRMTRQIVDFLSESEERAQEIALDAFSADTRFWCDYALLAYGNPIATRQRLSSIKCDHAGIDIFFRDLKGPVVILGVHMGSFMSAGVKLAGLLGPELSLALLRRLDESDMERLAFRHMAKHTGSFTVLRHRERSSAVKVLSILRRGGALLTPIDLPPHFGVSTQADLFGHRVHFSSGPVKLAVATSATLVMCALFRTEKGCETLHFRVPLSCAPLPGETRGEAVERLMKIVAAEVEKYIRAQPGEWLMWRLLPAYFTPKP